MKQTLRKILKSAEEHSYQVSAEAVGHVRNNYEMVINQQTKQKRMAILLINDIIDDTDDNDLSVKLRCIVGGLSS